MGYTMFGMLAYNKFKENQYLFNRKCHVVDSLIAILLLLSQLELHELARDLKIREGDTRGNVKPFVFIKFRRAKGCLLEG